MKNFSKLCFQSLDCKMRKKIKKTIYLVILVLLLKTFFLKLGEERTVVSARYNNKLIFMHV